MNPFCILWHYHACQLCQRIQWGPRPVTGNHIWWQIQCLSVLGKALVCGGRNKGERGVSDHGRDKHRGWTGQMRQYLRSYIICYLFPIPSLLFKQNSRGISEYSVPAGSWIGIGLEPKIHWSYPKWQITPQDKKHKLRHGNQEHFSQFSNWNTKKKGLYYCYYIQKRGFFSCRFEQR